MGLTRKGTPRIVVAIGEAHDATGELKNRRYLESVRHAGGRPIPVSPDLSTDERRRRYADMHGLLLTGGPDLDPGRYGETPAGSRRADPARDDLDAEAFAAARAAGVPVLGICRGLQAINVFSGGSLEQHVEGHESQPYPAPGVTRHPVRIADGSRLKEIIGAGEVVVNSYHHQAVTPQRLAPGLRASALAEHPTGDLVEGVEPADGGSWLVAVQCHPERESSPPELERLWLAFIAACGRT